MAMSGNGCHLLYPIDLPNDDAATALVKSTLLAIKAKFQSPEVDVDEKVFNASRITKLYGTMACKGDDTDECPHRRSEIVDVPDYLADGWCEPMSAELLQVVADQCRPEQQPTPRTADAPVNGKPATHNVERCLAYLRKTPDAISGQRGSDKTFRDACECARFGLSEDEGLQVLQENNTTKTGGEPWTDAELRHKIHGAYAKVSSAGRCGVRLQSPDRPRRSAQLAPGTRVKALDRDNIGTVVSDNVDTATVHFVSTGGEEATKKIPKSQLRYENGQRVVDEDADPIQVISSKELDETKYNQRFIVKQILVADQPMVIGGRSKTLKTSILIDLALSIGSGTPFLGNDAFKSTRSNVAILSGESGQFTIQETARRIARAKGVVLADADVDWGFTLPQLSSQSSLGRLGDMIVENDIQFVGVDPAYLCLMDGGQGMSANNMFDVGPLLKQFTDIGQQTNCTMGLCHHLRKWTTGGDAHDVPELEELAYGGFAAFFRQWILLGRREKYRCDGNHKLWLSVGGSAGHGGQWSIDIDEGTLRDDFSGRKWDVTLLGADESRRHKEAEKVEKKARDQRQKDADCRRRVLQALRLRPDGETITALKELGGLNGPNFATGRRILEEEGLIELVELKKSNGKTYSGMKEVTRTHPDSPGKAQHPDRGT